MTYRVQQAHCIGMQTRTEATCRASLLATPEGVGGFERPLLRTLIFHAANSAVMLHGIRTKALVLIESSCKALSRLDLGCSSRSRWLNRHPTTML